MKTLKKTIEIKAAKEKVWDVLFTPETYTVWASAFSPDAKIKAGDWKEGSKIVFGSEGDSGLVATVVKNVPHGLMSVTYIGEIKDGVETDESELKGIVETYILTEKGDMTHLTMECDMVEKYYDMMSGAWDKALPIVKELSER